MEDKLLLTTATQQRVDELGDAANDIVALTHALTINSESQYAAASEYRATCIVAPLKQIDDDLGPIKQGQHQLWKKTIALMTRLAAPFNEAKGVIDTMMVDYRTRERDAQLAKRAMLEQAMQDTANELALKEAGDLFESGDEDDAIAALDKLASGDVEVASPTIPVVYDGPKVDDSSVRTLKRFRVVDVSKISRQFLVPDTKAIQQVVTAMGEGAVDVVGGIEYFEREIIAGRG